MVIFVACFKVFFFLKYEGESDRQFRLILDVQNMMHNSLRLLDSKLAEILGRQERVVSMISAQQLLAQQQPQQVRDDYIRALRKN